MNRSIFASIFLISSLFAEEQGTGTRRLAEYPNFYFVESGTGLGAGVQEAIDSNVFNRYFTMDINSKYEPDNPNVTFQIGDVGVDFGGFVSLLNLPSTFWVDAFFTPGIAQMMYDLGYTSTVCPLLDTLDQIKASPIKTHTIMINRVQFISSGFNIPLETIEAKLYEINPYYRLEYIQAGDAEGGDIPYNNCLVATPP